MEISELNRWWKTNQISEDYSGLRKRSIFFKILDYLDNRQIIVITGLRRTGKTILLHQVIGYLLEKDVRAEKIIYFNFDLALDDLEKIFEDYKTITGIDYKKEKIFVFLDEVQKLSDWENKIKLIYDTYRNIKIFVSGSSSLFIEKKTKESLGGRVYSFQLESLGFREYLMLKGHENWLKNFILFKKEIVEELNWYIKCGGFPEIIYEKDEFKIKKYIKELVLDKIVYIDIPNVFDIDEPELLIKLLTIISSSPGIMVDYESLANDLNRNRKTISNYLFYLEKAFLIKKVYNFSRNLLTSEKKSKKFYPSSSGLGLLYDSDYGRLIETVVLQNSDLKFFYRRLDKEVDFILVSGKKLMPIEVKAREKVVRRNKIGMLDFMKKFNVINGIFITKDEEGWKDVEWFGVKKRIKFIPLWKWLLTGEKFK